MSEDKPGGTAPADPTAPTRASISAIRGRADLTAKAFGGLATTAVTGIGIAKFGDVFPWPGTGPAFAAAVLVVAGFAGMAAAVAFFTWRLWRVSEPIVMRSDTRLMTSDFRDPKEKKIVDDTYYEVAQMNGARSLVVLEARGHRLSRVAARMGSAGADAEAVSKAIEDGVQATYGRAALLIARRRASRALTSGSSVVWFAVFVVSLVTFGMSSDYLQSERADSIALVKACGEAQAANANAELPPICPKVSAPERTPVAPSSHVTKTLKKLVGGLHRCERAHGEDAVSKCAPLRRAISAAVADGS